MRALAFNLLRPLQSDRVKQKACLVLLCLSASPALAQSGEPLMVRSEAVGNLFRLSPPIYGTFPAQPVAGIEMSRTYANLWAQDKRYLVDAEVIDDRAHIYMFLSSFCRFGLGFTSRSFAHTQTDQIAITFHDIFRINQDGRLDAGKNHTVFKIPDYDLEFSQTDLNRSISDQINADVSFMLFRELTAPFEVGTTVFGSYEMAHGTPYSTGARDRGIQLNVRYPWDYGAAYAAFTQLYFDTDDAIEVATINQQKGWAIGAVQTFLPDQEIVGQLMVYQPVFRDLGQMSRNSYEVQLGYRLHWEKVFLEATLIENIFWLYNSPDWGISLGLRRSFP